VSPLPDSLVALMGSYVASFLDVRVFAKEIQFLHSSVLVMEAFSLNNMVDEGSFKFHWKCEKQQIFLLCFVE
jgi:hypothetical protein